MRNKDACHSCGNGHNGCVNPAHLYWGTHSENEQEKRLHGTYQEGELHPMSILKEDDVRYIRSINTGEINYKELSKKYGVSTATISDIRTGRSWKNVR